MERRASKGIRALAWDDLAANQYWPFVGGLLVMGLIVGVIAVLGIACVVIPVLLTGGGAGDEPFGPAHLLPAFLFSCLAMVPILYVIGYSTWGVTKMSVRATQRTMRFEDCLSGWGNGWRMCWTLLVEWTYIQLWLLLLIVPGVVKAFAYAMTPFVQVENPGWTANQCIAESQRLMDGNKWRYFCLNISFFGWYLLCVAASFVPLAGNFAYTFLHPYVYVAQARFYDELKREKGQS